MPIKPFDKYIFDAFLEWEKKQPKRRSSYKKFCEYLSTNTQAITITPQTFNNWINGRFKPDLKYIPALAEKLGDEIYDVLEINRPDYRLREIEDRYTSIPDPSKDTYYQDFINFFDEWIIAHGGTRTDKGKKE